MNRTVARKTTDSIFSQIPDMYPQINLELFDEMKDSVFPAEIGIRKPGTRRDFI